MLHLILKVIDCKIESKVEIMNVVEAAKELKITPNTLRIWEKIFNIPVPRNNRGRIYNEKLLDVFNLIKELKASNKEQEEIKSIIEINLDSKIVSDESKIDSKIESKDDIRAMIKAEIQEQTELSEKYAKATYKIGQLEAQLQAADEKIKLLPAPDELIKLKAELEAVKRENELLKMPWYKKIFFHLNYAKA